MALREQDANVQVGAPANKKALPLDSAEEEAPEKPDDLPDGVWDFLCRLRAVCATFSDEGGGENQARLDRELEILELFCEAVEEEETVLAAGEPIDDLEDELGEDELEAVTARLKAVCAGEEVDESIFPLQDDACHHPGCEESHCHDDEHFEEHCDGCDCWLSEDTHILCLLGPREVTVCGGCIDDPVSMERYLQEGYIDDEGTLQRARADEDALRQLVNQAAAVAGAASAEEFYAQREASPEQAEQFKRLMNDMADERLMGSHCNFDFLTDHANDLLAEMFA